MEMTITGTIHCRLTDIGSKSEGYRSTLTDKDGNRYKLYREDIPPYSDNYFTEFEGKEVEIRGDYEPETGNMMVKSLEICKTGTTENENDIKE